MNESQSHGLASCVYHARLVRSHSHSSAARQPRGRGSFAFHISAHTMHVPDRSTFAFQSLFKQQPVLRSESISEVGQHVDCHSFVDYHRTLTRHSSPTEPAVVEKGLNQISERYETLTSIKRGLSLHPPPQFSPTPVSPGPPRTSKTVVGFVLSHIEGCT
jgi:hypothetical protein